MSRAQTRRVVALFVALVAIVGQISTVRHIARAAEPAGDVSFVSDTAPAAEGDGTASLAVQRTGGSTGEISVDVAVSGGTASDGLDFTGGTETLTWADGDAADKVVLFALVDDPDDEPDETVELFLSNSTNGASVVSPDAATLTITDNDAAGAAPVLEPIADQVVEEGGTLAVEVSASDTDGGDLFLFMSDGPPFAFVSDSGGGTGTFEASPSRADAGMYTVTVTASDGVLADDETFTLTVTDAPNAAPDALDAVVVTPQDVPVDFTLHADDPDLDPLTFAIVDHPSNGGLDCDGSSCTYTPASGFFGDDALTFTANDGTADSDTATVSITVTENGIVDAVDDVYRVVAEVPTSLDVTANDLDPDTGGLEVVSASDPVHGSVDCVLTECAYTPDAGYLGPDSFRYSVEDVNGDVDSATVELDVVKCTSEEGACIDNGTILLGVHPEGHLNLGGGRPSAAGTTSVGLRFLATNHDSTSPGCECEGWGVADATTGVTGYANESSDFGANNMTVESFTATSSTAVSVVDVGGVLRVTHDFHPSQQTPNLYEVKVSIENISTEAVDLRYRRVMDWDIEPTAFSEFVTVSIGNSPSVIANTNDGFSSANPLSPTTVGGVAELLEGNFEDAGPDDHGALFDFGFGTVAAGGITNFTIWYGASEDEAGALAALAQAHAQVYSLGQPSTDDGPTLGTPNTFIFGFSGVGGDEANNEPLGIDDNLTPGTSEDTNRIITPAELLGNDTDVDGDALQISGVSPGAGTHGTAVLNSDGSVTYTPEPNYHGPATFIYTISDGHGGTDSATVTLEVAPVNDAPVADGQALSTPFETPLELTLTGSDVDDETLTFAIATQPGNGTLLCTSLPACTYTPDDDFSGADSFTFTASDGELSSASATVTITVEDPDNQAPVLDAVGNRTVDEGSTLTIQLSATDADGDALTLAVSGLPAFATFTDNGDGTGSIELSPDFDDAGVYPDIVITASDGSLTDSETITITVNDVNRPPFAADDEMTVSEDDSATSNILTNDADLDGDTLGLTSVTQPEHGSVDCTPLGSCTYAPNPDYHGPDSFTYSVGDGRGGTDTATVTVAVTPVNDAPVADGQALSTPFETPLELTLTGSDVDDEALTFAIATQPANGTLDCTASPHCAYTPDDDFSGADSFTFTASDGELTSAPATVTVTVGDVNTPPAASDATVTVRANLAKSFTLLAFDNEGDELTYIILTEPTNGSLDCSTPPDCTYTPDTDFVGEDGFTFKVNDGTFDSNVATVTLTVALNNAPDAVDDEFVMFPDFSLDVSPLENDTDPDSDDLTFTADTQPGVGSLVCDTSDTCRYTPPAGFTGTVSFTYSIDDGFGGTDTATVTIHVEACPVMAPALDGTLVTGEEWIACPHPRANAHSSLSPSGLAPSGGISALLTSGLAANAAPPNDEVGITGAHGTSLRGANDVSILRLDLTVPAEANCLGFDFVFGSDEYPEFVGSFNDAFLAELDVNDWSVAGNDITAPHNFAFDAAGNVVGVNSAFFDAGRVVTDNGTEYDGATPVLRAQTPVMPGAHSLYLSIFDANDHVLDSGAWIDNLSVSTAAPGDCEAGANQPPTAVDEAFVDTEDQLLEDTPAQLDLLANDSDPDGDTLTISGTTDPEHGSIDCSSHPCTYTPDPDYFGPDSFDYTISDGRGGNDTATVTLTIAAVNDVPLADEQALSTPFETPLELTLTGSDVDDETLTFAIDTQPANGTLDCTASPDCVYTPDDDFSGEDSFTFTASDGELTSAPATVTITVGEPANRAPLLTTIGSLLVAEGATLTVTLSATDADGDQIVLSVTGLPDFASFADNGDGTGTIELAPGFEDAGVYADIVVSASDGTASDSETITITVTDVNRPPTAVDDEMTVSEDDSATSNVLTNDTDPDGDTLSLTSMTQPEHGSVVCTTVGSCTYTPEQDYDGQDSFTYSVSDGRGGTDTGLVTVSVTPVNDAPLADAVSVTDVEQGEVRVITLTGRDIDSEAVTFSIVSGPSQGSVGPIGPADCIAVADGVTCTATVTYTADSDAATGDSFTYAVNDGELGSGPATVSISIVEPADPTISIGDVTRSEGNAGTTAFAFEISLSEPPSSAVSVDFDTADGTATAPSDYAAVSGTLTWAVGDPLTRTVSVQVAGNLLAEPDEIFEVRLSAPFGATIEDGTGTATIENDDVCTILGTNGGDNLVGTPGPDVICALSGDDTLNGLGGADTLLGDAGTDRVTYFNAPNGVTVDLLTGGATGWGVDVLDSIENITGSEFADTLIGSNVPNHISGIGGADRIEGNAGDDTLIGLDGNDSVDGGTGADEVFGNDGNDTLIGGGGNDDLLGGNGVDSVDYRGSPGGVTVNLDRNQATGWGVDSLSLVEDAFGSFFADTIIGNRGVNALSGSAGPDTLIGLAGDDELRGGDGVDTVDYSDSRGPVSVSLRGRSATGDGNDFVENVENVIGTDRDDTLVGDDGANLLIGLRGDDSLNGWLGNDDLRGGVGVDTVLYNALGVVSTGMTINLNSGTASGIGSPSWGTDSLSLLENAFGTPFVDTIIGTDGVNELFGTPGNDTINGLGGNDTVFGGDGHDTILGGNGNDELNGNEGNDDVNGQAGADSVSGQDGVDQLTGGDGRDSLSGGNGQDQIFGNADGDTLVGGPGPLPDTLNGGSGRDTCFDSEGVQDTKISCERT